MRTRKVTRSVPSTRVRLTVYDASMNSSELSDREVVINGKIKDNETALKQAKKDYKFLNEGTSIIVKAEVIAIEYTKYVMNETDFIANATKID